MTTGLGLDEVVDQGWTHVIRDSKRSKNVLHVVRSRKRVGK